MPKIWCAAKRRNLCGIISKAARRAARSLSQIGSGQSDEKEKNDEIPAENDTAPLARIGKTVFKRKMYAVLMTALILSAFLVSVFGYLSSPEYLPYSPDTVSVGETADGALAVSFGENVTVPDIRRSVSRTARMSSSTASKRGRLFSTECFFIPDGKTP